MDTTLVGGAGSDTYSATQATLSPGDVLSGGAGNDTLAITSTGSLTPIGTGVVSTSVETVRVTATGATTVDTTQFDGVTNVTNTGSTTGSTVSFTGLKAIPAINVNATNSDTSVAFATGVTSGTTDAATVNLSSSASIANVLVTVPGIETINVVTSGGFSGTADTAGNVDGRAVTISTDAATAYNISGATGARLSVNFPTASATITGTVTSLDGAEDITVTAANGSAAKVNVNLGAGNDTFRLGTAPGTAAATSNWTVSGGAGTDTLVASVAVDSVNGANISDFEAVRLTNASAVTLLTTKNTVSTATFDVTGGSFTGLASGGTVNLVTGGSATVANSAWVTGTADSLSVNVGTAASGAGVTSGSVTAEGVETITITNSALATDTTARTNTVTQATSVLKTLTVNSASTGALALTAAQTTLTSVNASGVNGNLTFTSAATAGASVTGGAGNDVLGGGAGADTIIGGAGADSITGNAGADSLDGGDGADTIIGGNGADTLTGGGGADRFDFVTNNIAAATPVTTSTTSAFDTITDFTSGTDKINITGAGAPVAFLGNFTNYSTALAATNAAVNTGVLQNSAAFVISENMLYVFRNNDGTANANDMAIKLNNVTALATNGSDLLLGSQSNGNDITIDTTTVANVTSTLSTGASATSGVTTNTPLITSATTTDNNDTVRITTARLGVAATIDGGAGNDTLTVSNSSTTTPSTAAYTVTLPTTVTGFEVYNLPNAQTTGSSFVFVAENFTNNRTHFISASSHLGVDGVGADLASNVTPVLTIDARTATASQALSITGGAGNDSIRGGAGNDTINGGAGADTINLADGGRDSVDGGAGGDTITGGAGIDTINGGDGDDDITLGAAGSVVTGGAGSDIFRTSMANAAGSSFTGGTGTNDQITFTDSGAITLAAAVSGTTGLISQIETINLNAGTGASTLTVTPGQNLTVVMAAAAATIAGTGNTITVTGSAGQTVTLSGTSNFVVAGNTTGAISSTATGTLGVTASANDLTVTSASATTIDAAALTGDAVGAGSTGVLTLAGAAAGTSFTVTGLGTAALVGGNGAVVTEDAALRGTVEVRTAGGIATTITQVAGNTGAFTTTVGGTGAVALTATASHASQTINLNATGALTVQGASTSTAYTVNVGGTAGAARTYVNSSTTLSVDTYTGGTGVDDVTAGLGGDTIDLGVDTAADIVRIAAGDTAIAVGFAAGTAVPTTAITTVGMDVIRNFGAQDTIILTGLNFTAAATTLIRNGGTMPDATNAANTANALILGVYNAVTNTFTPSLTGTDSLFVFDGNGVTAAGTYRGVVLVGFTDPLQNDIVTAANPGVFTPTGG